MMWTRTLLLLSLSFLSAQISAQTPSYPQKSSPVYPQSNPRSGMQTNCPWLTQGSAAKALGGDVSVTATMSTTGEGTCNFRVQNESLNSLEILVSKAKLPTCPADSTKLTGIGNEALRCRLSGSKGETTEMVSSRVRDVHVNVTLTSRSEKAPAKASDKLGDVLEQIAEQVVGNLY